MSATSLDPRYAFDRTTTKIVAKSVPGSAIVAFLVSLLCFQQVLLWCFLGLSAWLFAVCGGGMVLGSYLVWSRGRSTSLVFQIDWRLVSSTFALSLIVFALGGEGRFFYQTSDWQVRNAVLHDLTTYQWPFAYAVKGEVSVLRAPVALYLIPALVGKLGGLRCAEFALLVQSATFLACILSLGAGLFQCNSQRLIALVLFIGFSGMDVLGTWLVGGRLDMHLEWWNVVQFSSTVTQAYWVPMHAIAGWLGAVLYLLWRVDRIPLAWFLAPLPLLALLSPLALIGVVPFACAAGISAIRSRSLQFVDVALPFAAVLVSIPSLLYLSSGTGDMSPHVTDLTFTKWAMFELLEVIPYLVVVIASDASQRFGQATMLLTGLILLLLPWAQLGAGPEIPMRASIAALAILSVMVAQVLIGDDASVASRLLRTATLIVFLIGSVTPVSETWRAIHGMRQAFPTCSYYAVVPDGAATYVAPLERMNSVIAPQSPALARPRGTPSCREINWRQWEMRYVLVK